MSRRRDNAGRLRTAVDLLPRHTREAMLRGIESNPIIVGGYTDKEGGVCPMLAAHRNGGRTSFASFARAWDAFTGAGKRPRRASRREIRALRTYLEMSLLEDDTRIGGEASLASIANQIRTERRQFAVRRDTAERTGAPERPRPGDPHRARDLRRRPRWSWLRPTRRYDVFQATMAAASEQISEQRADDLLPEGDTTPAHRRPADRL
ncbi:MAG: hypothetical protein ACRDKV_03420 [Solirubrobacterales bacterium]